MVPVAQGDCLMSGASSTEGLFNVVYGASSTEGLFNVMYGASSTEELFNNEWCQYHRGTV